MATGPQAVRAISDQPLAQVIPIGPPRSCFTCMNSRYPETPGGAVTWCRIYDEVVDSEAFAAQDCLTYERCEDGAQPDDLPTDFDYEDLP